MVYCVFSLDSPRWGDSNKYTQYTFMLKKIKNAFSLCLLTWRYDSHSLAQTTPVSEHIFMVPRVSELLKFTVMEVGELKLVLLGSNHPFIFCCGSNLYLAVCSAA